MRGKVTANRLNIRSRPSMESNTLGQLVGDVIVNILGHHNRWYEIEHQGGSAFVADAFLQPVINLKSLKGRVKAEVLKVRAEPGLAGKVIGSLPENTMVNILAEHPDWLEIDFNNASAYVYSKYIELLEAGRSNQGRISADLLNVRRTPSTKGEIIGVLDEGQIVELRSHIGNWYEISFNGDVAYIYDQYVIEAGDIADTRSASARIVIADDADTDPGSAQLAPEEKLEVTGSTARRKVARTWNKFGNLLNTLSDHYRIEPACAVAVLCVESAGKGFEKDNRDRMIVRFENHKFWKYWGKQHALEFNSHFKYGVRKDGKLKSWLGHQWRANDAEEWQDFHGSQEREWQVLEFARNLDDSAALLSISMGAPQIMGFHYQRLGYSSVQDMFDAFSRDIRFQIMGFFEFLDPRMVKALQDLDFSRFAASYNGTGQEKKYGGWIQDNYDAFKSFNLQFA
ncbi:MAG: N-acetylmuramidase domain-containing protein [Proteobacteria bacterium]|nr:N-acetylmuramidase domain-containing protein [Pseudomonadota bacterium]